MTNLETILALKAENASLEANAKVIYKRLTREFDNKDIHAEWIKVNDRLFAIKDEIASLIDVPEVGKYANKIMYSDVEPYEIVKLVTDKTIEIRPMIATLTKDWKPDMRVGGFAAHTINNDSQTYEYESDETASVIRVRKHKDGNWYGAGKQLYRINVEPIKFYDYNF